MGYLSRQRNTWITGIIQGAGFLNAFFFVWTSQLRFIAGNISVYLDPSIEQTRPSYHTLLGDDPTSLLVFSQWSGWDSVRRLCLFLHLTPRMSWRRMLIHPTNEAPCFHPDKSANSYLGIKVGGFLNKESWLVKGSQYHSAIWLWLLQETTNRLTANPADGWEFLHGERRSCRTSKSSWLKWDSEQSHGIDWMGKPGWDSYWNDCFLIGRLCDS